MLQGNGGSQWAPWLDDPQILVSPALADKFGAAAAQAGNDGALLLAGARSSMVDAIHSSQWIIVAFVVLAFWLVRRVPPVDLHSQTTTQDTCHD
jgi:hypothetical protein